MPIVFNSGRVRPTPKPVTRLVPVPVIPPMDQGDPGILDPQGVQQQDILTASGPPDPVLPQQSIIPLPGPNIPDLTFSQAILPHEQGDPGLFGSETARSFAAKSALASQQVAANQALQQLQANAPTREAIARQFPGLVPEQDRDRPLQGPTQSGNPLQGVPSPQVDVRGPLFQAYQARLAQEQGAPSPTEVDLRQQGLDIQRESVGNQFSLGQAGLSIDAANAQTRRIAAIASGEQAKTARDKYLLDQVKTQLDITKAEQFQEAWSVAQEFYAKPENLNKPLREAFGGNQAYYSAFTKAMGNPEVQQATLDLAEQRIQAQALVNDAKEVFNTAKWAGSVLVNKETLALMGKDDKRRLLKVIMAPLNYDISAVAQEDVEGLINTLSLFFGGEGFKLEGKETIAPKKQNEKETSDAKQRARDAILGSGN